MSDYNDGNWHGWNGGDCPVHPESLVHKAYASASDNTRILEFHGKAHQAYWSSSFMFRVVKPYVEPPKPREAWVIFIGDEPCSGWPCEESALRSAAFNGNENATVVHMRQVTK